MIENFPGMTVEAELSSDNVKKTVDSIFYTGGLMLSQVSRLTGLEPYIIQNWVSRGFLSPPVKKNYSKNQFCRIAIINMLKESLQIDKICELLVVVNGHLDDESDDAINDCDLYLLFIKAIENNSRQNHTFTEETLPDSDIIPFIKQGDTELYCQRIRRVAEVMFYTYISVQFKKKAEEAFSNKD